MTPTEYQAAAARTLPANLSDRDRLSMLALGVVGEWGEYQAAKDTSTESEEAGDVLWYIAGLCTVLGVDLADLTLYRVATAPAMDALGDVCEPIKKHLYHGKDLDKARVLRGCARLYMGIVYSHNIGEVLAANVAKLKARWPDGFKVGDYDHR
jgi:NTP pyrophosphatase (non-canonical NTP hydrolase)